MLFVSLSSTYDYNITLRTWHLRCGDFVWRHRTDIVCVGVFAIKGPRVGLIIQLQQYVVMSANGLGCALSPNVN